MFKVPLLGATPGAICTWRGQNSNNAWSTSATFSGCAISAGSRWCFVGMMGRGSNNAATAVTVDGISLALVSDGTTSARQANSTLDAVELWAGDISASPNGTGNIVVTWNLGSGNRGGITWWTATGLKSGTAVNVQLSTANPLSGTLTSIPSGGFALGIAHTHANSSFTWTNLDEDNDTVVNSSDTWSGAHRNFNAPQGNYAVTAAQASSSVPCAAFASFR